MSLAADETRLGELLVTTTKMTQEELLDALQVQQQQGGPQRKRLGEILIERGYVTADELQTALTGQGKQVLWCPKCRVQVNVRDTVPGGRYACRQCQEELQPAPPPRSAAVRETWPAMEVLESSSEDISDEVRQALADPSRLIGRYAKLEELGRGGMGVVYRCYDTVLHRNVAIKMILKASEDNDQELPRFQREARAVAKLQHPSIVAIHEVGEHQGNPYLVMDFVKGKTFKDCLENDRLSTRRKVALIREVALALHHAHAAGIIHRDVKPQNIMVDSDGKPHVMDFGLARDETGQQQITQTGQMVGTPAFMAPEQSIESSDTHGPWTDIYALGAVLYQALTGRLPFLGDTPLVVLRKSVINDPEPLRQLDPTISPDLETISLKCLEKEPDRRYPSAAAVAEELQRFLDGQAILARPMSQSERASRWLQRNRALTIAAAVVVMVVIGATLVVMNQAATTQQEKQLIEQAATQAAKQEIEDKHQEYLDNLGPELSKMLDRVRSGEVLKNSTDADLAKANLLKHREELTARLLSDELNALSDHLATTQNLRQEQELLLHFLCETLWSLDIQKYAVSALGRYLRAELTLPMEKRGQQRAVPAGKALCLLGGEEADRLLREAKDGFGANDKFWSLVQPLYKRTGVVPELRSETAFGYFERGNARKDAGDNDGAIADFTRAIEIDPKFAKARTNRGAAHEANGELDSAISDYSLAIEIDPQLTVALFNRGLLWQKKGDFEGSIEDFTRVLELKPSDAQAWFNRGVSRWEAGDIDGAIADYTGALEIDPTHAMAWYNRGNIRKDTGNLDGAIADYTGALEADPTHAMACCNRAFVRQQKGDPDGAINGYSRAIEIDPNLAIAWSNRGTLRGDKGDLHGAVADLTRAIDLDPNFVQAWFNRGLARGRQGDLDDAIADFTGALKIDPNNAAVWFNRGLGRQNSGDLDGAIADYSQALKLNPQFAEASCNRGNLRSEKGDRAGAIEDWQRFLDLAPNHPVAPGIRDELQKTLRPTAKTATDFLSLAHATMGEGDLDGAIADFTRALDLAPNDGAAWFYRGRARQSKGDLDGAIADFTRSIEIIPDAQETWFYRGLGREKSGDRDGAMADYSQALEINPELAAASCNRGLLRHAAGDIDGAIEDWQSFLELAPNHRLAPEISAKLQKALQQRAKGDAESGK